MSARRPSVSFVSWSFVRGRSSEIAAALGGEATSIYYSWTIGRRWLVPFRYVLSSVQTLAHLVVRRPRSVIATLPPVFPGLVALLYSRLARAPFVLDSHPSGFGRKGDVVSLRLLPVHRWLARRAAATMVTTDEWVGVVESWGGTGIVVHEAPSLLDVGPAPAVGERFVALLVVVFSGDEPVAEALEAARGLDDVTLRVTGDVRRADPALLRRAPPNVEFVGFLDAAAYHRAVEEAHVVIALTTEPTSVMRAAYEAVYARRPLIASDWPAIASLFEHAVLVENTSAGIRDGIVRARRTHAELCDLTDAAFAAQSQRWSRQLGELAKALELERSEPS